jgi:hypothetical protein
MNTKYIITDSGSIVVFSAAFNHSDFKHMNPIRAGFISFGVNKNGNPTCSCYGSSFSLNLESNPELDTKIAKLQLNLIDY